MIRHSGWDQRDIGDLTGRTALVTGANSGIGYETARALSEHGAHVVLACRDPKKARAAADHMVGERSTINGDAGAVETSSPETLSLETMELDLADLASVRAAAARFAGRHERLDILVNNAGIMAPPYLLTADGFELQFGTNHLGHFALTGLLLDLLLTTGGARVVTVSSSLHRLAGLDFDDLAHERSYNRWDAYGASKLANLLFSFELARRLHATGSEVLAVAAHPGWARTNLTANGPILLASGLRAKVGRATGRLLGQSAASGALPSLYAATAPGVRSGQYVGPRGLLELYGSPKVVTGNRRSGRLDDAARLWAVSEELTGVHYPFAAPVMATDATT